MWLGAFSCARRCFLTLRGVWASPFRATPEALFPRPPVPVSAPLPNLWGTFPGPRGPSGPFPGLLSPPLLGAFGLSGHRLPPFLKRKSPAPPFFSSGPSLSLPWAFSPPFPGHLSPLFPVLSASPATLSPFLRGILSLRGPCSRSSPLLGRSWVVPGLLRPAPGPFLAVPGLLLPAPAPFLAASARPGGPRLS